jgi:hypothetical protein
MGARRAVRLTYRAKGVWTHALWSTVTLGSDEAVHEWARVWGHDFDWRRLLPSETAARTPTYVWRM